MSSNEIQALLTLNRFVTPRTAWVCDRLLKGERPSQVLLAWKEICPKDYNASQKDFDSEKEIEACHKKNIKIISIIDPAYPGLLKLISDPPILLYVRGEIHEADKAALAIVGSRRPTVYGLNQAKIFASELAQAGWTIVSGLALGVDQAAHEGTLGVSHGRTIAVLGCGVDVCYPKDNADLYERILERGALVSEYALGAQPLAHHFPRRNRIISGLSLATFVVEAHIRSGSLITAREALEQGRDVYALPGRIDQPTSAGSHKLIREGATLIDSPSTLNYELANSYYRWKMIGSRKHISVSEENKDLPPLVSVPLTESESGVTNLTQALEAGPIRYDEMIEQGFLSSEDAAGTLLELEIQKKIIKLADGRYRLHK